MLWGLPSLTPSHPWLPHLALPSSEVSYLLTCSPLQSSHHRHHPYRNMLASSSICFVNLPPPTTASPQPLGVAAHSPAPPIPLETMAPVPLNKAPSL